MTQTNNPISDKLKSWPINVLPHHLVSRLTYRLTRIESPLKNPIIRWFIKAFDVDMHDAIEQDITQFKSFNAFFTRALNPDARPIAKGQAIIASPVDGTVSQSGNIIDDRIFQAKGHDYSLAGLLGGNNTLAEPFQNGRFATIYLSPRDYHRIHMPATGKLKAQTHVPGRLFSVAPHTVNTVSGLFARNERVIAHFETEFGSMAMVLVGAINVAAIETVWSGLVTPPKGKRITETLYTDEQHSLKKGQEMGRFNMGSTVILLFENSVHWDDHLIHGEKVRMGERIATAED